MRLSDDLPVDSPARLLGERLLNEDEFEQAIRDVLALGFGFESSVRILAEVQQERVREKTEAGLHLPKSEET